MRITAKMLESWGADRADIEWFRGTFPRGFDPRSGVHVWCFMAGWQFLCDLLVAMMRPHHRFVGVRFDVSSVTVTRTEEALRMHIRSISRVPSWYTINEMLRLLPDDRLRAAVPQIASACEAEGLI